MKEGRETEERRINERSRGSVYVETESGHAVRRHKTKNTFSLCRRREGGRREKLFRRTSIFRQQRRTVAVAVPKVASPLENLGTGGREGGREAGLRASKAQFSISSSPNERGPITPSNESTRGTASARRGNNMALMDELAIF